MLGVPSPTIPLPPGLELGGRYRLGPPVRGLPGQSYLAHDQVQDRAVVVKLLAAMPFEVDLARLEQCLAPLRAVDAAWLPRPLEVCEAQLQGRHCAFLVQELLEGESLEERVQRDGVLRPAEARVLARRLLELLRTMSAQEPLLIHGDIHPGNVLLTEEGGVALVDWGQIKAAARDWSTDSYGPEGWTQAVRRSFVAPEVPMGSANPRSDLYGVGASLAFALTGLEPEAILDMDPRRLMVRALEQLHLPRSFTALLVPLLESTLEQRLATPSDALELLLDPLAGRRGGTTVRRTGEPVDWYMEPRVRSGALWSGGGVAAAALIALPLLVSAIAVVLPVGFGMAGWVIALRMSVGLTLGGVGLLVLRAGLRGLGPMGRLRLEGMGRALRYQHRRQWVEIPWLQLGRVRKLGPVLRIDGAWCVPPAILPRRRVLWIAPVYEVGLDRLVARIGAHRARARALVSGSLRHSERRWPGARRPPLGFAAPAGLAVLLAVLLTGRWGGDEPQALGGLATGPVPDLATRVGSTAPASTGHRALEERLAQAAGRRPSTPTGTLKASALDDFEGALAEVLGEPLPIAEEHGSVDALSAAPPSAPELHLDQAIRPLDPEPASNAGSAASHADGVAAELSPSSSTAPPSGRCPRGFELRVLAPAELMAPACWDDHGTMVRVPARGSRRGFMMDWTEVSVSDYAACVGEGACEPAGRQPGCYGAELSRGTYPVNCVDRAQAADWCAWAGRRLCSASEHERAATGPGGGVYPWGDASPACERVVMDTRGQQGPTGGLGCGRGGPWPVGSRPAGVSAVGALDLSGNVAEWVTGGVGGVAGGGYMDKAPEELQASSVRPLPSDLPVPDVGFRCCLSFE